MYLISKQFKGTIERSVHSFSMNGELSQFEVRLFSCYNYTRRAVPHKLALVWCIDVPKKDAFAFVLSNEIDIFTSDKPDHLDAITDYLIQQFPSYRKQGYRIKEEQNNPPETFKCV